MKIVVDALFVINSSAWDVYFCIVKIFNTKLWIVGMKFVLIEINNLYSTPCVRSKVSSFVYVSELNWGKIEIDFIAQKFLIV